MDILQDYLCVVASKDDEYKWKTSDCSLKNNYFCEATKPCPDEYQLAFDDVCLKVQEQSSVSLPSSALYTSIHTATKLCLNDGTRLFTSYGGQEYSKSITWLNKLTFPSIIFQWGWRRLQGMRLFLYIK